MLSNYLKIAFRNLFKQKAYSLFNLFGLSLGIACTLVITIHIKEELSYEKGFPKHKRIFRVTTTEWSKSTPPLAGEMAKFFPEIEAVARFSARGVQAVSSEYDKQGESTGFFADSTVVRIFDFKAIAGNPVKALAEPMAVIITRSMAQKYFGTANPIGQKLVFNNEEELWVRAVIEDLTQNTHLSFDYLVSMPTFYKYVPENITSNRNWMFGWTYVLFNHAEDVDKTQARIKDFFLKYYEGDDTQEIIDFANSVRLQPLTDIHLHSNLIQEIGPNSSILYIYIFIGAEILILIAACINFINLFTTQALKRFKEVGVRKILGAKKTQIIWQFLSEAFVLTIIAGLIAMCMYWATLPIYNTISGRQISNGAIFMPDNLLILTGIVVFSGFLSGMLPAYFISNVEPVSSLKILKTPRSSAQYLRKGLIVFQFVISSFLIISTVLIYQQMHLFNTKQLGFDKEQILAVKLYGKFKERTIINPETVRNELLKNPNILTVGKSSSLIGDDLSVESVVPVPVASEKNYPTVRVFRIDENYLNVMGISLKAGRNFLQSFNDSASFIINEKAASLLGLKEPLGATLVNRSTNLQGKVIGVVPDFHFASLHHQVEPLVLEYNPLQTGVLLVKIKPENIQATIAFLQKTIRKLSPEALFSYTFLDERIAGLYKKENNMSTLLKLFSVLSMVISCLGLFGLAAHASEIRTKEIGIRKVLGASVTQLVQLFAKEFILLILIGNLIAWPIAWYAVHQWLQAFPYQIEVSYQVFTFSTLVILGVALLTIGYHCVKTALDNPVQSLRSE
jgi:putative ABC transport system permease protein